MEQRRCLFFQEEAAQRLWSVWVDRISGTYIYRKAVLMCDVTMFRLCNRSANQSLRLSKPLHETRTIDLCSARWDGGDAQYLNAVVDVLVDEAKLGQAVGGEDLGRSEPIGVSTGVLHIRTQLAALVDSRKPMVTFTRRLVGFRGIGVHGRKEGLG
jgi:hypothetical protein